MRNPKFPRIPRISRISRISLVAIALAGCSQSEMANSLQSLGRTFSGSQVQANSRWQPYNQAGGVSRQQISQLRHYAKGQSLGAMRSLIGTPNYISPDQEQFFIQRTGDGIHSQRRLTVLYRSSPDCNYQCSEAYDWYID